VYAAKSLEHLRRTQYWRYGIHGEVNLWGTVVEHEHGWRAQLAYPRALFLPVDIFPYTLAAIQSRLRRLIAYGADIFVADPNGNIKLWSADSGFDSAGLECLIEKTKEYHDRSRQRRTFKQGERVALLGLGIAVVWQIDDQSVQVVLGNKHSLRIARSDIAWNHQNMRWETGRRYLNQGQKTFQAAITDFRPVRFQ
jgi:preprotein translocase subunit YajC